MLTIKWKPDRNSTIPLHKQITAFIREQIASGEWTVGTRLPSQRELARQFHVNRSTIVTALNELAAEGFIEGKSGGGTKVINTAWSQLMSTPPPDWISYVKAGLYQPNLPTIQEINEAEFKPNMIRLGTGELSPELINNDLMQRVLEKLPCKIKSFGYEEPKGLYELREQVSKHLNQIGINAPPSSILIVSGALQALQLISIGLLHRGSIILTEKPSYLHSLHVFQSAGMQLFGIPLDSEGVRADLISSYKKQYTPSFLYTIPTFQNPTGILMSEERRKQLLAICQNEQLPLIEDDVYRDLWIDEKPAQPIKAYDNNGMVLYLGSMSKALSPGLRIGWVVGPEAVINRLADIKMQSDYGSSTLSQWAAYEWLSSTLYQDNLSLVRSELKKRRDLTLNILEAHFSDIATWEIPKGGFYIWVKLLPSISMKKLFEDGLSRGILLNPGNIYHKQSDQYLRISYSFASLHDLEYGLSQLSEIIRNV
ncbi:PLP-dependent aminotransferase family protein [Gracilibacillus sp. HCP3S3_G5_1]|uniref:aminotransferase-like domain-containing protein n=1 Tax=unclassified Gracilibacillus TaxID=2625209 RepID=UPI003F8B5612